MKKLLVLLLLLPLGAAAFGYWRYQQYQASGPQIAELEGKIAAAEARLQNAIQAYETHRDRVRESAKGEKLASLRTKNGETYSQVTIRSVNAVGVDIRHQHGSKRIPFEELSADFQERFQYDPEERESVATLEQQQQEQFQESIANEQSQALSTNEQFLLDLRKNQQRKNIQRDIALKESEIRGLESAKEKLLAQKESGEKGSSRSFLNRQQNIDTEVEEIEKRISKLETDLQELRRK